MTPSKAARAPRRSRHPVKWLTGRDRTALNNLGLALLASGVLTAISTWLARFTSSKIPWWPVIAGLAACVLGLVLAVVTIGARSVEEPDPDPVAGNAGATESSEPAVHPPDGTRSAEPTHPAPKYDLRVSGDVYGLAQGDSQIVPMNFAPPGLADTKQTGAEPPVHDGE